MTLETPLTRDADGAILGDEVFAILGEAIRDGRLAPGQRLRDVDLAESLGVSRTPVREALQRLELIGLVEVSANRFTRVRSHDSSLVAESHEYLAYSVGIGLRMSLARCSDVDLEKQLDWADAMIAASSADDHPALMAASTGLYSLVSQTSGNRVFLRVMQQAGPFFQLTAGSWRPRMADVARRTQLYRDLRDASRSATASVPNARCAFSTGSPEAWHRVPRCR